MCASYGLDPRMGDYKVFVRNNDADVMARLVAWAEANAGEVVRPTGKNLRNLNPIIRDNGMELGWWGQIVRGAPAKFSSINTRLERIVDRPGLASQRALVPATEWYEYQRPAKTRYAMTSNTPFAFAGLTTASRLTDGTHYVCYSIITGPAAPQLETIHDRMPLVLPPEFFDDWLDPHAKTGRGFLDAAVAAHEGLARAIEARPAPAAGSTPSPALF